MSSQNIKSVLIEERSFPPSAEFTAKARLKPADVAALRARSGRGPPGFLGAPGAQRTALAQAVHASRWTIRRPRTTAGSPTASSTSRTTASTCISRSAATRPRSPSSASRATCATSRYRELHADVCRFANALLAQGVKAGDRVVIYMPLVPEAVVAMHACARIGAIHSVVFGGFSALSLRTASRMPARVVLITADGGWRGGKIVELKEAADKALSQGCASIAQRHRAQAHRRTTCP